MNLCSERAEPTLEFYGFGSCISWLMIRPDFFKKFTIVIILNTENAK